jgi:hypothetical protein
MPVLPAATRGGKLKNVHSEFDDGYIIGYFGHCGCDGSDYTPISFVYYDQFDCPHDSLLASNRLYHEELKRSDGGWAVEDDSEYITFSWRQLEKVICGYSEDPKTHEHLPKESFVLNEALDTEIEGIGLNKTNIYRRDRSYWSPEITLQNAHGPEELFGLEQKNPDTCPPDLDKCGNERKSEEMGTSTSLQEKPLRTALRRSERHILNEKEKNYE